MSSENEPWQLTFDDGGQENPALRDHAGHIIADVYGLEKGRRIVDCVNECIGMVTTGEPGRITHLLSESARQMEQMAEDRKNLLGALKECLATYSATANRVPPTTQEAERQLDRIRATNKRARDLIATIEASL